MHAHWIRFFVVFLRKLILSLFEPKTKNTQSVMQRERERLCCENMNSTFALKIRSKIKVEVHDMKISCQNQKLLSYQA